MYSELSKNIYKSHSPFTVQDILQIGFCNPTIVTFEPLQTQQEGGLVRQDKQKLYFIFVLAVTGYFGNTNYFNEC